MDISSSHVSLIRDVEKGPNKNRHEILMLLWALAACHLSGISAELWRGCPKGCGGDDTDGHRLRC